MSFMSQQHLGLQMFACFFSEVLVIRVRCSLRCQKSFATCVRPVAMLLAADWWNALAVRKARDDAGMPGQHTHSNKQMVRIHHLVTVDEQSIHVYGGVNTITNDYTYIYI